MVFELGLFELGLRPTYLPSAVACNSTCYCHELVYFNLALTPKMQVRRDTERGENEPGRCVVCDILPSITHTLFLLEAVLRIAARDTVTSHITGDFCDQHSLFDFIHDCTVCSPLVSYS